MPQNFGEFAEAESQKWAKVIRTANINAKRSVDTASCPDGSATALRARAMERGRNVAVVTRELKGFCGISRILLAEQRVLELADLEASPRHLGTVEPVERGVVALYCVKDEVRRQLGPILLP